MREFCDDVKLDFSDVMLVPQTTEMESRKQVNLFRKFTFKSGESMSAVPVVAANMATVGTISMARAMDANGMITAIHKHYDDALINKFFETPSRSFFTIGVSEEEQLRAIDLYKRDKCKYICIDIANGYMKKMLSVISRIRKECPLAVICAGNVVTSEKVRQYAEAGADIVKLGIGPGSLCTSRRQAGVGYPQLSVILECKDAAKESGVFLMSDGGCTCPGDVAKAFCAGADFVMLGGMLAGHDECELEFHDDENGNKYAYIYGMSSTHAMEKHNGGMKDYRSSEGRVVKITPRGPVNGTLLDLLGGLRSCGTYIDAKTIEEFSRKGKFVQVNRQLNNYFGKD